MNGVPVAVIFPEAMSHSAVANHLLLDVQGAGFVNVRSTEGGDVDVEVYGKSETLRMGPSENDVYQLKYTLGLET